MKRSITENMQERFEELVLGFTRNLWHPMWIVFQTACAVIVLHRWSKGLKERKIAH